MLEQSLLDSIGKMVDLSKYVIVASFKRRQKVRWIDILISFVHAMGIDCTARASEFSGSEIAL